MTRAQGQEAVQALGSLLEEEVMEASRTLADPVEGWEARGEARLVAWFRRAELAPTSPRRGASAERTALGGESTRLLEPRRWLSRLLDLGVRRVPASTDGSERPELKRERTTLAFGEKPASGEPEQNAPLRQNTPDLVSRDQAERSRPQTHARLAYLPRAGMSRPQDLRAPDSSANQDHGRGLGGPMSREMPRERSRQDHRRRVAGWSLKIALATSLGLAAAFLMTLGAAEENVLTFTTETQTERDAGRVVARADRPEAVVFSDGSRLTLDAGSSLRVSGTHADGAMVVVEEGQVHSRVTHREGARWSVFAGPYEIRVIGTRFDTTWDPEHQRMSVVLHEGSVQVLGKGIDELVELKPGQRFDASGDDGAWAVRASRQEENPQREDRSDRLGLEQAMGEEPGTVAETPDMDPVGSEGAPAPEARAALTRGVPAEAAPSHGRLPGESPRASEDDNWPALIAAGRFDQVVRQANAWGVERCLSDCSPSRLRALADAARYTGQLQTAEQALLRLRAVAPSEAARAGFLLGSLNEARGRSAVALKWYGQYLRESPAGGLSAEAHAGQMRALAALGRSEAAKAAAREYLRLYPAGAGAKTARQILHSP